MDYSDINFTQVDRDSTSLWFRPLRQLLDNGKPLPRTTMLTYKLSDNLNLPIGALCTTYNKRVIFWPALPKELKMYYEENASWITDHITLELPNEKIHITGYLKDNSSKHHGNSWRLEKFQDNNYALWFNMAIRKTVIENQELAVECDILMPNTDRERRIDEINKYVEQLVFQSVSTPSTNNENQYFYFAIYLEIAKKKQKQITTDMFMLNNIPNGVIEDSQANELVVIHQTPFTIGNQNFVVATASPSGTLKEEYFGFPTTKPNDN